MKLFDKNMTSVDAMKVLFSALEGKNESEKKTIMDEYKSTIPLIMKKELHGAPALTSYQI